MINEVENFRQELEAGKTPQSSRVCEQEQQAGETPWSSRVCEQEQLPVLSGSHASLTSEPKSSFHGEMAGGKEARTQSRSNACASVPGHGMCRSEGGSWDELHKASVL